MTTWQRGQLARQRNRLGLSPQALDDYCLQRFGSRLAHLSRRQARLLGDELGRWRRVPPEVSGTPVDEA
ncbi:MAG TPA: hypothetical protein VH475_13105 [Tepidisphaeraceae bacterium]|jgi:hypothetical protein